MPELGATRFALPIIRIPYKSDRTAFHTEGALVSLTGSSALWKASRKADDSTEPSSYRMPGTVKAYSTPARTLHWILIVMWAKAGI
jgi:hypothetical protein